MSDDALDELSAAAKSALPFFAALAPQLNATRARFPQDQQENAQLIDLLVYLARANLSLMMVDPNANDHKAVFWAGFANAVAQGVLDDFQPSIFLPRHPAAFLGYVLEVTPDMLHNAGKEPPADWRTTPGPLTYDSVRSTEIMQEHLDSDNDDEGTYLLGHLVALALMSGAITYGDITTHLPQYALPPQQAAAAA